MDNKQKYRLQKQEKEFHRMMELLRSEKRLCFRIAAVSSRVATFVKSHFPEDDPLYILVHEDLDPLLEEYFHDR